MKYEIFAIPEGARIKHLRMLKEYPDACENVKLH